MEAIRKLCQVHGKTAYNKADPHLRTSSTRVLFSTQPSYLRRRRRRVTSMPFSAEREWLTSRKPTRVRLFPSLFAKNSRRDGQCRAARAYFEVTAFSGEVPEVLGPDGGPDNGLLEHLHHLVQLSRPGERCCRR